MIKNSIIESHDLELLKDREIQGLYAFKNSCQSFWTLKAKVELSVFQRQVIDVQDHKNGEMKHEKR